MLAYVKRFDIFGYPVGVTYKGESSLKTHLGAFVTLGYYILALANLSTLVT